MTEIPEDVMEVAHRIASDYAHATKVDEAGGIIGLAILSERERCAKIAEHLNGWGSDRGAGGHAEHIAAAIRNP